MSSSHQAEVWIQFKLPEASCGCVLQEKIITGAIEKILYNYVEKLGLDCSEHFVLQGFAKKNMFMSAFICKCLF